MAANILARQRGSQRTQRALPGAEQLDLTAAARLAPSEVLARLGTTAAGLSTVEAQDRLRTIGPNVLSTHRVTAGTVLLRQLRGNPLLLLLLAAAAVSGATGDPADAAIIAVIVLLSVGLGFLGEFRSERAVAALHAAIHHTALVGRDGVQQRVDVSDLVPGDVLSLGIGDVIPADVRLLETTELECDEAVLTGESMPRVKSPGAVARVESTVDLPCCAFMGTVVHQGAARGIVVATGSGTAFGKIAVNLSTPPVYTAFQAGLTTFSKMLTWVGAVLTIGILIINVALGRPLLNALLFSLAIAVGITPELMPAIVTTSLAAGSRQLARKKVLVKRLVTIEDLGNIQVLFTDKTGTLTTGTITFDASLDSAGDAASTPLRLGLVCNEATMTATGPVGGNLLDQALWSAPGAAALAGSSDGPAAYTRLGVLPFDHERQVVSVLAKTPSGSRLLVTKGAPEAVLAHCVETPSGAAAVLNNLFEDGARVVAVATRDAGEIAEPKPADERDLHLAGFLTFQDPPKADAGAAIAQLRALGVDVKVITGDNGIVAAKICREIGLDPGRVLSTADLDRLDDDALADAILTTNVFARISPEQKSRIIKVARGRGQDVAFMGDGVNDAVALHDADVGISVDSATDVAKDAADIVLLEKDLGVLADGVTEGRRVFANTIKYVQMATSSNFGSMFSAAGASLFLSFLPMLPSQILLNNLLYDVGQMAIPTDTVDPEIVARPVGWDIGFVRRFMVVFGLISSIFDFLTFFVMLHVLNAGPVEFRSGWFIESLATQTLVVFIIRTRRVPFMRSRPSLAMLITPAAMAVIGMALPFTPVARALGFTRLPGLFFLILLGMILIYLALVELAKYCFYAAESPTLPQVPSSPEQRHTRRLRRRSSRFVHHSVA